MEIMKRFIIALQFLTIVRLGRNIQVEPKELGRSMGYFPMVGLVLGFILVLFNTFSLRILPAPVVDAISIVILIISTGALHLDGLADTIDGLAGGNSREEILQIMCDSNTGAIGAVGLTMTLLLKYIALMNIPHETKNQVLLAMPMIGRWSMVELSLFSKYARSTEGIGLPFTAYLRKREFLFASATAILASFALLGIKGIIIMIVIGLFVWGSARFLKGKIGGITGDTFGAVNEISEVLALILVLVLLKNF